MNGETIKLTVPASLEFVRIVRLTASGVASRLGFDIEDIEDLRVAVDELASLLVEHADSGELEIEFAVDGQALVITGRAPAGDDRTVGVEELTSQILSAVVDDYGLATQNGHVRFHCTRRLPTT